MKEKKKILLASIGILMLVLVTVGVTYAVFTYTKLGTTENTVTTGTLKFLYTENTGVGAGINIENAFPVSDTVGKSYDTDKYVFDFSVEATNSGSEEIPYEVTLRKKSTSTLSNNNVKVYLTDMTGDADTEILAPTIYSDLVQTTIDVGEEVEKTIYNGTVLGGELTYLKDFRLRMWIDNNSNQDDINGKKFTALVNVYSNVPLVSEEEINSRNSTELGTLTVDGTEVDKVTGEEYDYEITVDDDTTSVTINADALNPDAEIISVEKIDSLTYRESEVKKIATSVKFDLVSGINYFKITVTSENKQTTDSYILRVNVGGLFGFAKKIIDDNPTIYTNPTLTTSSNNSSDASGLYVSTATNDGNPTYYFRGAVENNYVDFAGFTWRIVRINEDGTIRIISADRLDGGAYSFRPNNYKDKIYMYYSSGDEAKPAVEQWYTDNILNKGYSGSVATGDYFCEQAKVAKASNYANGSGVNMPLYNNYTPNFTCQEDANGYGLINSSIGLITYDEVVHAGAYYNNTNTEYYLYKNYDWWTMSPSGYYSHSPTSWAVVGSHGCPWDKFTNQSQWIHVVINLKPNVSVIGNGTSGNHYVVQ